MYDWRLNYGEHPDGDITQDATKAKIPEKFDILCGGFPCQAFQLPATAKAFRKPAARCFLMWRRLQRSTALKRFLENVKNLISHDEGNTFQNLQHAGRAGHTVSYKVLNSTDPRHCRTVSGFSLSADPKQAPNYQDFEFPEEISDPRFRIFWRWPGRPEVHMRRATAIMPKWRKA